MIIWGGTNNTGMLNSGGIYNPGSDTWTTISTDDAPVERGYHTAIWTGSKMIVWGGLVAAGVYRNSGAIYDPETNTWTTTSMGDDVPSARYKHSAVWTGSRMIIWSGFDGAFTKTGGIYNPTRDAWAPLTVSNGTPSGRLDHSVFWYDSKMIIWGGYNGSYLNSGGVYSQQ